MRHPRSSPLHYDKGETAKRRVHERAGKATAWESSLLPKDVAIDLSAANRRSKNRLLALSFLGAFLVAAGLLGRLFYVQVVAGVRYSELANGNRLREHITYAPRGRILDRKGRVLAENTVTFQLAVTPYLLPDDEPQRTALFEEVAAIIGMPADEVRNLALARGENYARPILLRDRLSHRQALLFGQKAPQLAGFSLDEVPVRKYHYVDIGLAHVLGYVGRVSEAELEGDATERLLPIDFIGKAGIEKQYDEALRGRHGFERTEVDALGRPVRVLGKQAAQQGKDVTLAVDVDVQRRLAETLRAQMQRAGSPRASGVVVHAKTGEVLAMVSMPAYDNNLFAQGISAEQFAAIASDPNQPLVNKTITAAYTTGSTIKPLVASAALQENVITPETVIVDRGFIDVVSVYDPGARFRFRGYESIARGPLDLRGAIAISSNVYFYTIGGGHERIEGLGVDRLTRHYREFGLGERSGIDLPGESAGLVPDREWKKSVKGEDWFVGDTYNISIGQGDMLVTPLQLGMAEAAIANGGKLLAPRLLKQIDAHPLEQSPVVRRIIPIEQRHLQVVREGMRRVLQPGGTTCECTFRNVPVQVAGKSGTAENASPKPHSWFSAFAPYQDAEVSATVMVENGINGSEFAAPPAAAGLEAYFKGR